MPSQLALTRLATHLPPPYNSDVGRLTASVVWHARRDCHGFDTLIQGAAAAAALIVLIQQWANADLMVGVCTS